MTLFHSLEEECPIEQGEAVKLGRVEAMCAYTWWCGDGEGAGWKCPVDKPTAIPCCIIENY